MKTLLNSGLKFYRCLLIISFLFILNISSYKAFGQTFYNYYSNSPKNDIRMVLHSENKVIFTTSDSGFIEVGHTEGGVRNAYVIKTDALGVVQWNSIVGTNQYKDEAYSVVETFDSQGSPEYIVVGLTNSHSSGGNTDVLAFKLDSIGGLIWANSYGFSGSNNNEQGLVIMASPGLQTNSFMIAAQFRAASKTHLYFLAIDIGGGLIADTVYSFDGYNNPFPRDFIEGTAGDII
ncbi:MAG: hypothetical protein IH946_06860, partial [Bacteroidetes bacterium]|nr:hypothetical protein [Bacteroidota bacterium]